MSEPTPLLTKPMRSLSRIFSLGSDGNAAVFFRGAGGTFVVQIASAGLLFASQAVFARIMGVESFGIYVLAYAWLNLLLLPSRQGFDIATVRFVATYQAKGDWGRLRGFLTYSKRVVLVASVVVALAMAWGAWLFRSRLGDEAMWALWFAAATLPWFAQIQIQEATLRGLGFVVRPQLVRHIFHPIVLLAGLPVAVLWLDLGSGGDLAMAIFMAATALSFVGMWAMLRNRIPKMVHDAAPVSEGRKWLKASFAMMFLMSFGAILNQISGED